MNNILHLALMLFWLSSTAPAWPAAQTVEAVELERLRKTTQTLIAWREDAVSFFVCAFRQSDFNNLSGVLLQESVTEIQKLQDSHQTPGTSQQSYQAKHNSKSNRLFFIDYEPYAFTYGSPASDQSMSWASAACTTTCHFDGCDRGTLQEVTKRPIYHTGTCHH